MFPCGCDYVICELIKCCWIISNILWLAGWLVGWLRCSWILDNILWLAVACWQQSTSGGILPFPAVAVVHYTTLVLDWLPLAALVAYCAAYWYVIKYVIWIMILTCAAAGVMIFICDRHSGLSSRFPPVSAIFPSIFVRFRTPVFSAPAPNPGLSDPDPVSDDEM